MPRSVQSNQRRVERLRPEGISTPLGDVVDLSSTGIRIAGTGKPALSVGQSGNVKISTANCTVSVCAKVVWIRRRGFKKFECGLEFQNVKPGVRKLLESISQFGFVPIETDAQPKRRPATLRTPDYYQVLGVAPNASDAEIHNAYRELARKWHPDVCQSPDAEKRFNRISEAYSILRDEEQRALFDLRAAV